MNNNFHPRANNNISCNLYTDGATNLVFVNYPFRNVSNIQRLLDDGLFAQDTIFWNAVNVKPNKSCKDNAHLEGSENDSFDSVSNICNFVSTIELK